MSSYSLFIQISLCSDVYASDMYFNFNGLIYDMGSYYCVEWPSCNIR